MLHMPGTSWRNVAGYVTFDAPKCQGTLSRTLTYLAAIGEARSLDGACGIRDFVAPISRITLHFIRGYLLVH